MAKRHEYYAEFCPEGTLKLTEYALEAANAGIPMVVLRTRDAIVCAAKKNTFEALEVPRHANIARVSERVYLAVTGHAADVDQITDKARTMAAAKTYELGFDVTADILARALADERQTHIQRSGERPMAFSAALFGFDDGAPLLYHTDTSAVLYAYRAVGIGENGHRMNKYLEKGYCEGAGREDALVTAVRGLGEAIGSDFAADSVLVCYVESAGSELTYLDVREVDGILQRISEAE